MMARQHAMGIQNYGRGVKDSNLQMPNYEYGRMRKKLQLTKETGESAKLCHYRRIKKFGL